MNEKEWLPKRLKCAIRLNTLCRSSYFCFFFSSTLEPSNTRNLSGHGAPRRARARSENGIPFFSTVNVDGDHLGHRSGRKWRSPTLNFVLGLCTGRKEKDLTAMAQVLGIAIPTMIWASEDCSCSFFSYLSLDQLDLLPVPFRKVLS